MKTKRTRQDKFIGIFPRLKTTVPFSTRFNEWIEQWFEDHKDLFVFVDKDDFDETDIQGTFDKHVQRFKDTRKIHIWTGASDHTIFGEPTVNHKFRAWHDYIHVTYGYGYDFVGESICSAIQQSMLPTNWHFERNLVHAEIVGQAQYFMVNGNFLNDQRRFTYLYLQQPQNTLTIKDL